MRAAAKATTKQEATRLRQKCNQLITLAEQLKTAQRAGSSSQPPRQHQSRQETQPQPDSLLNQSSRLHGNYFPPWTSNPAEDEFVLPPNKVTFADNAVLTLSPKQEATFGGWKTLRELYPESDQTDDETFMGSVNGCDLVQDLTTDCSVVASLCAATRILTGRNSVLSSILYPFDHAKGMPKFSASGKYVLRLHFNGCSRRVVIDERLPASITDRTLYVVDRQNPRLVWPALLEKAYLKVRGGYDFPGSNSGTDLWVLTGWIPEQLFLQREDLDINAIWKRIKGAHDSEDVVVTLGTGRISAEEEDILGLIGEHDYAVMDLDIVDGNRRLLVKNPWSNGPVWKRSDPASTPPDLNLAELQIDLSQSSQGPHRAQPAAGSFWMPLEDVVQHFESMYLNWNPALFAHRQDNHFPWRIPPARFASSLVRNPQYALQCPGGGPVWILISRHFMDAELQIARTRTDSMAAVSRQLGFMSILVFDNKGHRVQVGDGEVYRGPYVDSPQTLARLETSPSKWYTIVLDQHEFPLPEYTFTFSFFSQEPVQVNKAGDAMAHSKEVSGSWTRRTAGGNPACSTYFQNPQFKLRLSQPSPLSVLLSTNNQDVHVHVDLVWAQGKRVTALKSRDLLASSGEYRRGCSVADVLHVDAGVYTVVCSTFDAGQTADFALRVSSMVPVTLEPIPADAAGRLRTPLKPFRLSEGEELRRAPLSVSWLTRMSVTARSVVRPGSQPAAGRSSSTLVIRLSVVHGWAPERTLVAVSGDGEFQEPKAGMRTPELDMEPARIHREGMWLVMESMGTHNVAEDIEVELHSDAPVHVGPWEIM
ncbi:hypothetical protein B0T10DRAFT_315346 [Thelonectria olida]|uniref:Calpain catalytic domain-containing protein n=1 Tax=Thelonectria olida TaxID=1576542 RepID=A0A9P8W4Q1_9HYPO|nr:hypothetical protein B0T10DRAFT_315346 [Thelonectria olida]